jgi:putative protease
MKKQTAVNLPPEILAPAGNRASFLAAIAAGADAVYCGLKLFSARMEAKNFAPEELAALVALAHEKGARVFLTVNTLLKPDDLDRAGRLIDQVRRQIKPDALIVQDLALIPLIRQTGFRGEIHLSTLANVIFSSALRLVRQKLDVDRVVLPRELNIDELKALAADCPPGLGLEVFIHGALCYGVSGRCYWSSYFGGKSGLRGRCVQPCRRLFTQKGQTHRFFSCRDLSLDVLVKVLSSIPQVRVWKIEGRKKSPHYVYTTVTAYRMLRDHGRDPQVRKDALERLSRSLGRPGSHYHFLPQRPRNPVNLAGQTGSGMLIARIKGTPQRPFLSPQEELLSGDVLRIGYEDQPGHLIKRIGRFVPKGGHYFIKSNTRNAIPKGTPVFLTDRREQDLDEMLSRLEDGLHIKTGHEKWRSTFKATLPARMVKNSKPFELHVYRKPLPKGMRVGAGYWLSLDTLQMKPGGSRLAGWWWLPPVIWPDEEQEIRRLVKNAYHKGARHFVLNAPWQISLFPSRNKAKLWAGPFCNLANPLSIATIESLGFAGAIVSPELGRDDIIKLPRRSPIPLGIVIAGNWPLCVSRIIAEEVKLNIPFASPKGEQAWVAKYDSAYWVFPNWRLDLTQHKKLLQKSGYSLFVHLIESLPKTIRMKKREGLWNWKTRLR